jgi:N-acylneuraminate cytidylyltransferase
MNVLVIIPARAGSKGIPNKNWKPFLGKPLILYSIEMALKNFPPEQVVVSSNAPEVAELMAQFNFPNFELRPEELSQDLTTMQDVILYELHRCEKKGFNYDAVLLLQPTSPLRRDEDIKSVLECFDLNLDMVLTVCKTKHNPYSVLLEKNDAGEWSKSKPFLATNRQSVPPVYAINGAVYLMSVKSLKEKPIAAFSNIKTVIMPEHLSIDIDTPWDWKVAELAYPFRTQEMD